MKRCSRFLPLQESGLSAWIGGQLHPLESVPPVLAVLLITVVVAFFTEFASNTATIIIFLPVLAELVRVLTRSWDGRATSLPNTGSPVSSLIPGAPRGPELSSFLSKMHKSVRTIIFLILSFFFFSKKCINSKYFQSTPEGLLWEKQPVVT